MKLLSQSLGTWLEVTQFPFPVLKIAGCNHFRIISILKIHKQLSQFSVATFSPLSSLAVPSYSAGGEEVVDVGAEHQKNCHWLFASCCSKSTASPCSRSCLSLLVLCGVYNTGRDISCKCHRSVIVNSLLHRRLLWNKTQEERTIQNLRNITGELWQ